jgi:hypothetical protein
MTLHPDVLTDLVILYHAGEASQATRALLEEEAGRNPQLSAALRATTRPMPPLPANTAPVERRVMHKVRLRYQVMTFGAIWVLVLLAVALIPKLLGSSQGIAIVINLLPFLLLALVAFGALAGLYFLVRTAR